jgi:uncharacterized membrane protein
MQNLRRWCGERSVVSALTSSGLAMAVLLIGPSLLGQPPTHRFLVWNLALAWVPLVAAVAVQVLVAARRMVAAALAGVVWLLFLPNAPYLLSDLSHLHEASTTPWLDLARFVSFAWAGTVVGLLSVRMIHRIVAARAGAVAGYAVVVAAAAVSGLGIAIGRFARLNSWEVLTRPWTVTSATLRLAGDSQAVAVGAFFAALVLVMYLAFGSEWRAPRGSARV